MHVFNFNTMRSKNAHDDCKAKSRQHLGEAVKTPMSTLMSAQAWRSMCAQTKSMVNFRDTSAPPSSRRVCLRMGAFVGTTSWVANNWGLEDSTHQGATKTMLRCARGVAGVVHGNV